MGKVNHPISMMIGHPAISERGPVPKAPSAPRSPTDRRAIGSGNTQLEGDDVAFVMRDEWKEEPVSTTGAEYVEPSATELSRRRRG
jgi:hypothetical protein